MIVALTRLFPLWALLLAAVAYWRPEPFAGLAGAIVPLLGVVMFGMGITLTPASFAAVARRPGLVALGVAMQYTLMPLLAWLIGTLLGLPQALLVGLVLVGSCPGGTASNVICYLARGDVALSITLTAVSTLLALLATPLLTWAYVGATVPVPISDMLLSMLTIVIVPVLAGLLVNRLWGHRLGALKHGFPLLSVLAIALIIAIVVALKHEQLAQLGPALALAVAAHNLSGLGAGYLLARLLGHERRVARTLAIEVGMQNSGLAVALANQFFSATAALPGALFSIWHNVSGALLAGRWSRDPDPGSPQ